MRCVALRGDIDADAAVKNDKGGGGATIRTSCARTARSTAFGRLATCATLWHQGLKYIAASAADMVSYLLRSDGAVDQVVGKLKGGAKVDCTINPTPGCQVRGRSTGQWASYLLRDDEFVDHGNGGKITATRTASRGAAAEPAAAVPL